MPKNKMIELTPLLRHAITKVFDDGQQNWDRGEGWPPDAETKVLYDVVKKLTIYDKSKIVKAVDVPAGRWFTKKNGEMVFMRLGGVSAGRAGLDCRNFVWSVSQNGSLERFDADKEVNPVSCQNYIDNMGGIDAAEMEEDDGRHDTDECDCDECEDK